MLGADGGEHPAAAVPETYDIGGISQLEKIIRLANKTRVRSARYARYLYPVLFILLDYIAILLAEQEALGLHHLIDTDIAPYAIAPKYFYLWVPMIFILFLGQSHAYRQMHSILDSTRDIFFAVLYGFMACLFIIYFSAAGAHTSRLFVGLFIVLLVPNLYLIRYLAKKFIKKCHLFYEPVILVGAGKTAERVLRYYRNDLGYRYDIVGLIDDNPLSKKVASRFLLYGKVAEAEAIIRDSGVQNVIITAPGMHRDQLQDLISKIQPYVRDISFAPDLIGIPMLGAEAEVLFSEEVLMLHMRNNLARRRNRIIKRVFDLICTTVGSILISPILLVLTIMVAISNKGHVIFAHQRVGRNGEIFPCYKFQTMIPNAQEALEQYLKENPEARKEWEENFKLEHDPRVTKLGAFLRKTSLDELPQLWNVIKGDMSLVGPRPIVTKEIERYGDYFREYSMVLPGITGMWQASGRSDTTYEERVAMDTWYVRNWSVWIDLMYLFKTVKAVAFGKGAY